LKCGAKPPLEEHANVQGHQSELAFQEVTKINTDVQLHNKALLYQKQEKPKVQAASK
jgi:hypothetical protein